MPEITAAGENYDLCHIQRIFHRSLVVVSIIYMSHKLCNAYKLKCHPKEKRNERENFYFSSIISY